MEHTTLVPDVAWTKMQNDMDGLRQCIVALTHTLSNQQRLLQVLADTVRVQLRTMAIFGLIMLALVGAEVARWYLR